MHYAHSRQNESEETWQPLDVHLKAVAKLASAFGAKIGASEWARYVGLWHDLGKYSVAFQNRIRGTPGKVDHSTAGAINAMDCFGHPGLLAAYVIAGHHTGLQDYSGTDSLQDRLEKRDLLLKVLSEQPPQDILHGSFPHETFHGKDPVMLIRMLMSCLIDADHLDTELFYEKAPGACYPALSELLEVYQSYMDALIQSAQKSELNLVRNSILRGCLQKADFDPGFFSLTAPTGTGKTLAALGFALKHAVKHGKERIIYVIPYTGVLEQIADCFRAVFGDVVVEHHSNVGHLRYHKRLACENWDAPIIVTTNVQFFESLQAAKPGQLRKLHNIVNSVVILDEAQLMPVDYLKPILKDMRELVRSYKVSLVISSATLPRFDGKADFTFSGLSEVRELVDDPSDMHLRCRRVHFMIPKDVNKTLPWTSLAERLCNEPSVLCIVNRRDDCKFLWTLMPKGTRLLSALMCGEHRSAVITDIRKRLLAREDVRLISTQLAEAGVDLDFPVVYRAMSGVDSIEQAAGRCNREGNLSKGQVVVFVPQSRSPKGVMRHAEAVTKKLFAENHEMTLDTFEKYFSELIRIQGSTDRHGIIELLSSDCLQFQFRTAASRFHMVTDDFSATVMTTYHDGKSLGKQFIDGNFSRRIMRAAQRFMVRIPSRFAEKLQQSGRIVEIDQHYEPGRQERFYVQLDETLYCDATGFEAVDVVAFQQQM